MPSGHQGDPPPAYHRPHQNQSATSPLQPSNFHPHQHHPPPPSPITTDLPPIGAAIYSRDTSRYYDPTSDNGDRAVNRDPARHDNHYPPHVCPSASAVFLFISRDQKNYLTCPHSRLYNKLTLDFTRLETPNPILTADLHKAPTKKSITHPSQIPSHTTRLISARCLNINTPPAWRPPCRTLLFHPPSISR